MDSIPPIKEKSQEAVNGLAGGHKSQEAVNGSAGGHKSPEGGKSGNLHIINNAFCFYFCTV